MSVVASKDPILMMKQALTMAERAENFVVKITFHGRAGEPDNVVLTHELETIPRLRVNVKAMMSAPSGASWRRWQARATC